MWRETQWNLEIIGSQVINLEIIGSRMRNLEIIGNLEMTWRLPSKPGVSRPNLDTHVASEWLNPCYIMFNVCVCRLVFSSQNRDTSIYPPWDILYLRCRNCIEKNYLFFFSIFALLPHYVLNFANILKKFKNVLEWQMWLLYIEFISYDSPRFLSWFEIDSDYGDISRWKKGNIMTAISTGQCPTNNMLYRTICPSQFLELF